MHNRRAEGDAAHSAQSEVDKGKAARNEDEEMQEEAIAHQAEDPAIKEFWGIDPITKQTPATNPAENSGVSPIQARKPNNSS